MSDLKKLADAMDCLSETERSVIMTKIAREKSLGKAVVEIQIPAHDRQTATGTVKVKAHTRSVDIPDSYLKASRQTGFGAKVRAGAQSGASTGRRYAGEFGATVGAAVGSAAGALSGLNVLGSYGNRRRNEAIRNNKKYGNMTLTDLADVAFSNGASSKQLNNLDRLTGGAFGRAVMSGGIKRDKTLRGRQSLPSSQSKGRSSPGNKAPKYKYSYTNSQKAVSQLAETKTGTRNPLKATGNMYDGGMSRGDVKEYWTASGLSDREADTLLSEYDKPNKRVKA